MRGKEIYCTEGRQGDCGENSLSQWRHASDDLKHDVGGYCSDGNRYLPFFEGQAESEYAFLEQRGYQQQHKYCVACREYAFDRGRIAAEPGELFRVDSEEAIYPGAACYQRYGQDACDELKEQAVADNPLFGVEFVIVCA